MSVRVAEDIAWRRVAGETFVIDLRHKMMYGLNEPGGAVWQSIVDGGEPQSMLEELGDTAGLSDADEARPALDHFLSSLAELGLVTGVGTDIKTAVELLAQLECRFIPPQVTWSEEVRAVALSCLLQAGPCSDPGPPQEAV